jgi:predicted phosphodiesterase
VRFAVLSDIQGNLAALRACLDDIAERPDVDRIVCAGDIVGLGPRPNEVIDLLREREVESVKGNYDDAVAFERMSSGVDFPDSAAEKTDRIAVNWTRRALTAENLEHLRQLPFDVRIYEAGRGAEIKRNEQDEAVQDYRRRFFTRALFGSLGERQARIKARRILVIHGSPRALNEFIRPDTANSILETIALSCRADVVVTGHPGVSYIREYSGITFVGAGSVSGTRTPAGEAEFVIVDLSGKTDVEFVQVQYDPAPHVQAIADEGLPASLATRFDLTTL